MKQRRLEILLEQVTAFESPSPSLEQYTTPAGIAAELLYFALENGDLMDTVYDLGSGTGILAIGASLLGAPDVVGFDIDMNALRMARQSAKKLGVDVGFVCSSIRDIPGRAHTVVMNPPFGAQVKGSDRPFLFRALEVADVIYSIHNEGSHKFIKKFISPAVITHWYKVGFPLKRTFKFHKKDIDIINVEIYRIENRS